MAGSFNSEFERAGWEGAADCDWAIVDCAEEKTRKLGARSAIRRTRANFDAKQKRQ